MKTMKKIFSTIIVTVMLFVMCTTAFAAEKGSITINNAVVGETYTIFRLLDLESYNSVSGAYSYKANSTWETWLRTQTAYLSFDSQGYVTWVDGADVADFAKAAKEHAEANSISNQGSATAASTTVNFTDLEFGYYLVDTTLGTLCSLSTTDPSRTIEEKNEEPLIKKEVEEDGTGVYGKTNDAEINQVVNFKTTVTAKKGAEAYVLHDILSDGLTLDKESISIAGLTKGVEYSVAFDVACKDKTGVAATCDFEITFSQTYLDKITADTDIVITYSATLNDEAVIGLPGNPNDTVLNYSNDNWTAWDQTITYTWDLDVLKYANGNESKVLEGAKFVILNSGKSKVAVFKNGQLDSWAAVPTGEGAAWPTGSELTTDANGKISVDGLDAETYYLREIKAPDGYNKLASDVSVVINRASSSGGTLTYTTHVEKINNQSGTILPETGSTGTKIFIATGSLLALIAIIFIITRKKMSIYED